MKKLFLFASLFFMSAFAFTQTTFDALFLEFKGVEGVFNQEIGGEMLDQMKKQDSEAGEFLKRIDGMQIQVLSEASEELKNSFREKAKNINDSKYELLLEVSEGEDDVRIYALKEGDIFKEIIVVEYGTPVLVKMIGKLTQEDIEKISKDAKKK